MTSKEDLLFLKESKFIAGADNIKYLPKLDLPEIAFIGKSNVGKSSLINILCGRKTLARVSHTPGRTRQINLFSLGDRLIIADLPGSGYAKVPLYVKDKWEKNLFDYLCYRENLKLVNLLIDSRRGIQSDAEEMVELLLEFNRNFQIVLTKTDKVKNLPQLIEASKKTLETLGAYCNVIATNSRTKDGAQELRRSLGFVFENIR